MVFPRSCISHTRRRADSISHCTHYFTRPIPGCFAAIYSKHVSPKRKCSSSLYLSLGEWPRLPSTARIGRAQFHRARSASKEGTWPLPPLPSEAARSASTETMPAASPYPASSDPRRESVYLAPVSRWTDCTTQPCEHTNFSPLPDTMAHPRLAVSLSVVTYIDRVNISVTARQMMPAYGMTDQEMGLS